MLDARAGLTALTNPTGLPALERIDGSGTKTVGKFTWDPQLQRQNLPTAATAMAALRRRARCPLGV